MTISMDKTYQTRDGRSVRLLCTDVKNKPYGPFVVGLVSLQNGDEIITTWDSFGRYNYGLDSSEFHRDLIEVKQKIKRWVVFTKINHQWYLEPCHHPSLGSALTSVGNTSKPYRIIPIEFEDE